MSTPTNDHADAGPGDPALRVDQAPYRQRNWKRRVTHRRTYVVSHGYLQGFQLIVKDISRVHLFVDKVAELLANLLPFGILPTLLLNLGNPLSRFDELIAEISLTTAEAIALDGPMQSWNWIQIEGWSDDGLLFKDSRVIEVHCYDCGEGLSPQGASVFKIREDHAQFCGGGTPDAVS